MATITVTKFDDATTPEGNLPLYHRYTRQANAQPAYIELTESGDVCADISGAIGYSMSPEAWHGRTLSWEVNPALSVDEINDLLDEITPLLQTVHDGHDSEWDGSNYVGTLTEQARQASDEILDLCTGTLHQETAWSVWDAAEWLSGGSVLDKWPADRDLAQVVTAASQMAKQEHAYLDGDIEEYYLDSVQLMVENEEPGVHSGMLDALIADDRITPKERAEYLAAVE